MRKKYQDEGKNGRTGEHKEGGPGRRMDGKGGFWAKDEEKWSGSGNGERMKCIPIPPPPPSLSSAPIFDPLHHHFQLHRFVHEELFPAWGVTPLIKWYWLKVAQVGGGGGGSGGSGGGGGNSSDCDGGSDGSSGDGNGG